jgi:hypothetical protein
MVGLITPAAEAAERLVPPTKKRIEFNSRVLLSELLYTMEYFQHKAESEPT